MRRLARLLLAVMLLAACSRPQTPAAGEPEPGPPPAPVVTTPGPTTQPAPSDQPRPTAEPYQFTAQVGNDSDGPWSEYRPGIILAEGPLWLRLTANRSLPADAVKLMKSYLATPEGADIRLADEGTLLIGVSNQPVLWADARYLGDVQQAQAPRPFAIFAGPAPRVVEVDPETGHAMELVTLDPPPGDLPVFAVEDRRLTYRPLRTIPGFMQADLNTGRITPVDRLPAQPAPTVPALVYGGVNAWLESPSPDGKLVAYLDAPESARNEAGTPISLVIQEQSTGKVLIDNKEWLRLKPLHPCMSLGIDHAWSPDSRYLAALSLVGEDRVALAVLDVVTGASQRLAEQQVGDGFYQAPVTWSPDGTLLLFRHSLVEAATGQVRSDSVLYQNQWRPDGRYLLSAQPDVFRGYGPVRIINTASGQVTFEREGALIGWTTAGTALVVDWPNGRYIPIGPRECY